MFINRSENKFDSPTYWRLLQVLTGAYLLVHFVEILPYASALYSREGMQPNPALYQAYPFLPNILYFFDHAIVAQTMVVLGALLSIGLLFGKKTRLVAIALWYVWFCLMTRNFFTRNPSLPYVGWMLLVMAVVPLARDRTWRFPPLLFVAAWLLLAFGYSLSGWHKLQSPSWVDGRALSLLLENPLSRPTFFSELMGHLPAWWLKIQTWLALSMELFFLPLAVFSITRPWIWLGLVGMHVSIMLTVDFVDLSFAMLLFHLFVFDQRWIPASGERPIIFFDGVCSLCNHFIDRLITEDRSGVLRFASLQSDFAKQQGVGSDNPRSIVVKIGDVTLDESDAVLAIARSLGGFWRLFAAIASFVPKTFRDHIYRYVASHRYQWFGKKSTCRLPTPEEKSFFIA